MQKHNISFTNLKDVIKNNKVVEKFEKEVNYYNSFFNDYEKIKIFKLIGNSWSVGRRRINCNHEIKKKNILEKYKHLLKRFINNKHNEQKINKVSVIGSGIMGSRIACHFANIGRGIIIRHC